MSEQEKTEQCRMEGSYEMKGMEKQNLHSTAFSILYHSQLPGITPDLVAAAKNYLLNVMK